MILDIKYNTQVDNSSGKYGGGAIVDGNSQCGYAMAAHVAQPIFPDAAKDSWIAEYLNNLENGEMGKRVRAQISWYKGARLGAAINGHSLALQDMIAGAGLQSKYEVIQPKASGSLDEIKKAIDGGSPVGCCAWVTPSGHFETIIGYEGDTLIMHDSYGNFYPSWNPQSYGKGAAVHYPADWLKAKMGNNWAYYYYWKKK